MRYWWVNQNQTFRHEIRGGYLWSPKVNANGARNPFYESMREVAPGDLILSFYKQHIQAVGIAWSYCYENPKPKEFGSVGAYWDRIGWRIDVKFSPIANRIRPASHMDLLGPVLPGKYSPLQASGRGLQGVYLTEISDKMMDVLALLIGREVRDLITGPSKIIGKPLDSPWDSDRNIEKWEDHLVLDLNKKSELKETERDALIKSRRGQGLFRQRVSLIERACRITRVDNPEHLVASHCKPWRHSENDERLDGENGLFLTPSIDHLFDRGFISFEDGGRLLIAPRADQDSLQRMGVETDNPVLVGTFSEGQRRYLDFHRNQVFLASRKSA